MADDPSALPTRQSPLDRSALERVLARAAELQGGSGDPRGGDLLSESQLLDIGREVGLAPSALSQALAEERTRIHTPEEKGLAAALAGPSSATATRTVSGTQQSVLSAIDAWMLREECLQVQRRFSDRITWEPQRGLLGTLRRTVNVRGKSFYLVNARQVSATVLPFEAGRVIVRLDADLSSSRSSRLRLSGLLTGAGAAAGTFVGFAAAIAGVSFLAATAIGLAPFLLAGGVGHKLAAAHKNVAVCAQLALEQILDRLEHREIGHGPAALAGVAARRLLGR